MSRRRSKPLDVSHLAAERGDEDGADPKEFHQKRWEGSKPFSRKAHQLCGQVKQALHMSLSACADPALHNLEVASVEPAPHTGRLRVRLIRPPDIDADLAANQLNRALGRLRSETAAAINRRYTPELVFEVLGAV